MSLIRLAQSSPGAATAAAQKGLPKEEVSKLSAFAELRDLHNRLTSMPQGTAMSEYDKLPTETQRALQTTFHPQYIKKTPGFFGNILNTAKSAAFYSGGLVYDLVKQVAGIGVPTGTTAATGVDAGTLAKKGAEEVAQKIPGQEEGVTAAGKILNTLTRPQEKLIKQPYIAERLAEEEGQGGWGTYGRFLFQGAKELLPGGVDARFEDASGNFMKYWEKASNPNIAYDDSELVKIQNELTPDVAYVGQFIASKRDFVANFDEFKDNPKVLDLINRYVAGDEDAKRQVGYAVSKYEMAKISPGRDLARTIIQMFPHEAERAIGGNPVERAFFNTISGITDFGVTFGLDPLILAGKAKRASDVAKFGIFKTTGTAEGFEKAFSRPTVRSYWDSVGKLIKQYNEGDLATKGRAVTTLQNRFREINLDVFKDLAERKVYTADEALDFFDNGDRFLNMMSGGLGFAGKDTLIPRITIGRRVSNVVKNAANAMLGIEKYRPVDFADNIDDFSKMFAENPEKIYDKIGYNKGKTGFTAKDKSRLARIDRVVRQFEIAPAQERIINIADGSDATRVYRLARTVLDKSTASAWRAAWIGADEGQRLLMYRGLLKTLAVGMGLNHSEEGRAIISKIDDMSTELYSVSQSSVDLGDLGDVLKIARGEGMSVPKGVRKAVQDATQVTTAEGRGGRLLASINDELKTYSDQLKVLRDAKNIAVTNGDNVIIAELDDQIKLVGAKYGARLKSQRALKKKMGQVPDQDLAQSIENELDITRFNAGQTSDGTPSAVRQYQLSKTRTMPNFTEWREVAARASSYTDIFGKAANSALNRKITDAWSFGNLYPRLGVRTTVEEVGTFGLIGGAEGFGNYLKGRLVSRELRAATEPGFKKSFRGKDVEATNLGIVYNTLYKITKKHYSKDELLAMADDPEKLGEAVANSVLRNRFRPQFLQTKDGKELAEYAKDFARFDGKTVLDDINGASTRAERPISSAEETTNSLKQFGPSIAFNVETRKALEGLKFKNEFTEISSHDDKFLLHWFFELNNTVGKRNGKFGNIVLWNVGKKPDDVIKLLTDYINGEGNAIAKKFAIYQQDGADALAKAIYLDSTYALRDYSGRINMDLVQSIRNKGGMDKFSLDDLVKIDESKRFARPETIMGRELIPVGANTAETVMYNVINAGYGWVGKQIALLDREPITLANYIMFRKEMAPMQERLIKSLMNQGLTREGAEGIARFQAHESALGMARNRTLGFVDNSDVRTNLAYNLRTLGRYYRATEDFYRRVGRLAKYEKRAIVRLAILNQTFEHAGFIHKDNNGQMYFTYPGDDMLTEVMNKVMGPVLGLTAFMPSPVQFGGYVKMLTPSLDPESALPRLSNPFVSYSLDRMTHLPYVGNYLKGTEQLLTGSNNVDMPVWEKMAPTNLRKVANLLSGTPDGTASRFSAVVKSMRLLVSTGNGPKDASDIDSFLHNVYIQALNVDAVRFFGGLMSPTTVQIFGNKDVPKELLDAGVFTWDTEFQKILKKNENDPEALSKSLVMFAKLYPSKLAYTVSATKADTEANFRKTYEAANFVRKNNDLMLKHREGTSFFIPINGTSDYQSYMFLKGQGYVENKDLEAFLREAETAGARQAYFQLKDDYDARIAAAGFGQKSAIRNEWSSIKDGMFKAYPLLESSISPSDAAKTKKKEALEDLRQLVDSGKSPDKKLGDTFKAMITEYDLAMQALKYYKGSTTELENKRKAIRADVKDTLVTLSKDNQNAAAFRQIILEPLIGE